MAEAQEAKYQHWSYLDMNAQPQGPFPISYLQGLQQSGYFNPEVLFWHEGLPEWKALRELPELGALLEQPPPATAAAAAAAGNREEEEGEGGPAARPAVTKAAAVQSAASAAAEMAAGGRKKGGAVLASAPVVSAPPAPAAAASAWGAEGAAAAADPELAGFLAEISALEGEGAADAEAGAPLSPAPEDRTFVDDDGTLYVWDSSLRKFMPSGEAPAGYTEADMVFVADEEAQPAYEPPPQGDEGEGEEEVMGEGEGEQPSGKSGGPSEGASAGNGNGSAAGDDTSEGANGSKRKQQQEEAMERARERAKKAKAAREQQAGWFELKVNTSVYVTGLPEDVTEAEIVETFSKCGIIKEDDQRRPRVKIYRDKGSGLPKGDGLVTFLKEPSVDLAIQILDGAPLRYGLKPMSVSKAKFEQKGGDYVPKQDASRKRAKKKVLQKLEKDLGWGGFDDVLKPQQVTVILKRMFHPDELLADASAKAELEADVLAECNKLGPVDKVRVFAHNLEGVVSVKFKAEGPADECTRVMNGRFFGGRQLEAAKWDGVTNYNVKVKESEEEQLARLEMFSKEIEGAS